MFLEDKLENMYDLGIKFPDLTNNLLYDMMNACVHHIADHISEGMNTKDVAQVIKQTDNIWRKFAKKHNLSLSQDAFKTYYIDQRCVNHPQLGKFFKGE